MVGFMEHHMEHHHTIARAMTALRHPRRVALFEILEGADATGLRFEDMLDRSGLSISTLRHHLRPMQSASLVVRERRGRNIYFRLNGRQVGATNAALAKRMSRVPHTPPRRRSETPLN